MLYTDATKMVGNTPLLELKNLEKELGLKAHLFAKVESMNPAGSVKDRVAVSLVLDAEERGVLSPGDTLIEPTSGNTGIGLAFVCATRGYHLILTMPESMSIERRKLLMAYGAEIVLTPKSEGMNGSVKKAKELQKIMQNAHILGQFDNKANPKAHYLTTGPEIYSDLKGEVHCFVAGIGTGGTISGVGAYLKEQNSAIEIVGVEPASSPFLTQGKAGPHGIQGIGAGFKPEVYDASVCDRVVTITDEDAYAYAKLVCKKEGLLVGISSGAALSAAIIEAKKEENKGKNIVVLFPDSGDRYLSTALFEN